MKQISAIAAVASATACVAVRRKQRTSSSSKMCESGGTRSSGAGDDAPCCEEGFRSGRKRESATSEDTATHVLRLRPGDDVYGRLGEYVREKNIAAGFIVTCVGSVRYAKIRLASATSENRNQVREWNERFEIVSLVGTVGNSGFHLHVSLADEEGRVIGGHVLRGGLIVFTTAEIVLGECKDLAFQRPSDSETGFGELKPCSRVRRWVKRRGEYGDV